MNDWAVDSNVAAKWVLAEPDSAQALRVAAETASGGGRLFVLDFAIVEVTNVIWTRCHRHLLTLAEARQALSLLERANVQIVSGLPLTSAAFEISVQFDVAVYDALFVAMTRQLNVGGVTADEPLVQAVGAAYPEIKLLKDW